MKHVAGEIMETIYGQRRKLLPKLIAPRVKIIAGK